MIRQNSWTDPAIIGEPRHGACTQHTSISGNVVEQPSVLLAFLLVSREQTFTANFAIPNEGIEQMARKNDGAGANPNTSTARVPVMGLRA
jgi:hypothetical protein